MMKPNDRMTRQHLLDIVDKSLRSIPPATSQESVPGGQTLRDSGSSELSASVLEKIQVALRASIISSSVESQNSAALPETVTSDSSSTNAKSSPAPIPLMDVAAYVDGTLTNPRQESQITQSAMTDAGLLMEIVMARRSQRRLLAPPVSNDLRNRLLALQTVGPVASTESDSRPKVRVTPVSSGGQDAPSRTTRLSDVKLASVLAVATALLIGLGVWWFRSDDESGPSIALDPPESSGQRSTQKDAIQPVEKDNRSPGESTSAPPAMPGATLATNPDRVINHVPPSPDATAREGIVLDSPNEQDSFDPTDELTMPESTDVDLNSVATDRPRNDGVPNVDPLAPTGTDDSTVKDSSVMAPQPLLATWKQIDGVLVQSSRQADEGLVSESSDLILQSVSKGTSSQLIGPAENSRLRLETLAFCRAEAELATGGQLVLAPDTRLEVDATGAIDLQYGSIALLDIKHPSPIRLENASGQPVLFRVQDESSFVVRKTVEGMEVDTTDQGVEINRQLFSGARILLNAETKSMIASNDAPERLPKWTRGRVDRIELGRSVLASLASSNDVQASLSDALRNARDPKSAALLRNWLVTTHSGSLLSLVGVEDPLLREAALSHLRLITPADSRNRPLWQELRASSRTPRVVTMVHSYFVDLWAGKRPNATRFEQLLRLLHSREPAMRAMADYLLRSFYGAGPALDLNASAQARLRSANMWRAIASRADR